LKPYYETKLGKLYCGDCLEIMPELEMVDLIITSPPYNLGNFKKGSWYDGKKKGERLTYLSHNDNMPTKEYISWQRTFITVAYSKLTDKGAIFYNHKPRILNGIFDDRKNLIPIPIRQEIIWDKCGMINFSGTFFAPSTERIFIIAKDGWKPQKEYLKFGEVWRFPAKENNYHPAPFPRELSNRVIISASSSDCLIADFFSGSGTTLIEAEHLNRRWIGIEKEERYCEVTAKRIENETKQLKLF